MRKRLKHILLLLFLLAGISVQAQNYPVQANIVVSPPFNSYLPDYADPFNNQMRVILTLTDFAVPSYQVKLRFEIDGQGYNMQTADLTNFQSILLTPGVPVEISGADLAPYLATSNLQISGMDVAQYEQSKVLPEGPASICVQVVDANSNGTVIGNPACASTWFALYDPPLLNMPFCGTQVEPTDPQQVIFSWTPLHMASPNAGQTEYVFELFELRPDANADPNQVVNSTLPIYIEITTNTLLNYSILQPQLQIGMSYVWRVKAKDPSGRDLYNNNGYSAVCTFTYGSIAASLLDGVTLQLESNGTGVRQGLAWWNATSLFDSYVLEVRKTGDPNFQWFPYPTEDGQLKVNSLEPETEYECRVKGLAGGAETDWSNVSTFTTLPAPHYACGSNALPAQNQQIVPTTSLLPGNIVTVGQFEMIVTGADPTGPPGIYTGTGKINIPFMFLNFNVEFEDILVDEDLQMRSGMVRAISQPVDDWINDQLAVFVDGTINEIQFNEEDSLVFVYLDDGEILEFDWPTDGPLVIEDESGLIYTINPDGSITISGQLNHDDDNLAATKNHQITFHAHPNQTYGFDENNYLQWQENYPVITLSDGSLYFVPWKSIKINDSDKIIAKIHDENGAINSPTFKDENGNQLSAVQLTDSTYEVTIGNYLTAKRVYAWDDANQKVGKFNLLPYAQIVHEVVVIPVNGATVPNQAYLQDELNETFLQGVSGFTVTIDQNFDYAFDANNNGLGAPDATLMRKYSPEMRDLRDAYFDSHSNDNKYYLFVVPEIEGDLEGYMVRGKSVGFVEAGADVKTYAHELGHGAFGLEHTFPRITQGQSNNLLDYSSNDHLTAVQWEDMHAFTPVFSILDDEEDGSSFTLTEVIPYELRNADSTITVFSPAGKIITLPKSTVKIKFCTADPFIYSGTDNYAGIDGPVGSLGGFAFEDTSGNLKEYKFVVQSNQIKYILKDGSSAEPYIDNLTKTSNPEDALICTPYYNGQFGYSLYQVGLNNPVLINKSGFDPNQDNSNYAASEYGSGNQILENFSVIEVLYGNANTNYLENNEISENKFLLNSDKWSEYIYSKPGVPIKGEFDQTLSNTAYEYLNNNSQYTIAGHPFAAIVISTALWIDELEDLSLYNTSECIVQNSAEQDELNEILFPLLNEIRPEPCSTCVEQKFIPDGYDESKANIVNDKYARLKSQIAFIKENMMDAGDVNMIVSSMNSVEFNNENDLNTALAIIGDIESISRNTPCALAELTLANRNKLVDLIIQDDNLWDNNNSSLLFNLFNTVSETEKSTFYKGLRDRNWLQSMADEVDEWTDIDSDEFSIIDKIFDLITENLMANYGYYNPQDQKVNFHTPVNQSISWLPEDPQNPNLSLFNMEIPASQLPIFIGEQFDMVDLRGGSSPPGLERDWGVIVGQEIPYDFTGNKLVINGNYSLFRANALNTSTASPYFENDKSYELDPFSIVEVVFASNYNSGGYQKGTTMLVPAYQLLTIDYSVRADDQQYYTSIIADAAAIALSAVVIATAPVTWGGSLAVLESVVAGLNIYHTDLKKENGLEYSESESSKDWESFYNGFQLVAGATALPALTTTILKSKRFLAFTSGVNKMILNPSWDAIQNLSSTLKDKVKLIYQSLRSGKNLVNDVITDFSWIDDLTGNGWENLRALLRADLEANPNMFDNLLNVNGAEAWKRLSNASSSIRTNVNLLEDVVGWPASWNLNVVGNSVEVVQSSGRKIATITETKIIAPARTLTGTPGNPLLNRVPLVKNTVYDVDGILYHTDEYGRVYKTATDLDDNVRIRLGNQQIKAVDIKEGANGVDQGGHIVASRFFGPGEQINLYPQSANLNQGAWKQMENTWAAEMVAGKDVKIEVEAVFSGSSQRPDAFEVSYWIDGVKTEATFINQ
ncbi:MAG: DNA/RNA non-specific endonuclease [Crocinitomicaceae bacterium]|nr:DNA/RNA non-specific endonuclease [Crocinitomicaceae bacterium]